MNKKNIILTIAAILIVVLIAIAITFALKNQGGTSKKTNSEEVTSANSFATDSSIEKGEMGEYGKMLNDIELQSLEDDFKEVDDIINEL